MRSSNKYFSGSKAFFLILLSLVVSFLLSAYYQSNQIITGDQAQMLIKGFKAAIEGEYLPYGNAASVVTDVPGSLSSYLVGYPLSLKLSAISPIVLLLILRFLGILLFINALSQIFSKKTVVFGTIIYTLSPWFLFDNLIYNPTYLSFGSALFLNALVHLRTTNKRKISSFSIFFYSFFLTLSVGYCLQLHFSWPVLAAIAGILYLRKDIKISWIGIIVGLLVVAATLIPYIQYVLHNPSVLTKGSEDVSDRYLGYGFVHVYPMLKTILYWIRFNSLLVSQKAMLNPFDNPSIYLDIIYYVYVSIVYFLGVITVVFSAYLTYLILGISRFHQNQGVNFSRSVTIASLLSLLLAGALSPITFSYWHLIIVFPLSLLPCLAFIERKNNRINFSLLVFFAIVMIVINLVSATSSKKFSINQSYVKQVNVICLSLYDYQKCHLTKAEATMLLNDEKLNNVKQDKVVLPSEDNNIAQDEIISLDEVKENAVTNSVDNSKSFESTIFDKHQKEKLEKESIKQKKEIQPILHKDSATLSNTRMSTEEEVRSLVTKREFKVTEQKPALIPNNEIIVENTSVNTESNDVSIKDISSDNSAEGQIILK